ncbi:hypothetical protein B0T16DRAFT_487885 [Cercophora newfieldiana]|uniref:Fibronectin type-III domain-containing protein n=1 Tax=Cercophora newfieldiana TaxID=92897 RepID=A0AA39YSE2_9PEZI|nr:hypothetical protein B0T16DRAFT_487885 [Cercophora newfieldiana]
MSWISWTTSLVPTLLIVLASLAWWHTEPKTALVNLIAFGGVVFFFFTVAPGLTRDLSFSAYTSYANAITTLSLDSFVVRHANMLLTGAAVVWLVRRAWQTLWKPVPELISILGVDVPDPPDVSLAGIRADAATLNWTRAPANRSVQKFLIQVNGVVVGDVAANQEPAIVVSGLKPNHFYNVRVIAVGSNNFQAGSRVIRLRTFGQDGRPQLGNSRLPANFMAEEPRGASQSEYIDENGTPRSLFPALESTVGSETLSAPTRDGNSATGSGPRRNTVTRRHSPSTTSLDQAPIRDEINANSKKTLPELTEKFESIRKETEDVISQIGKEEAENRRLLDELEAEKQEKKGEQKKKEEQTERLKRDVHSTDRSMRNALQRKAQKEKLLKEKQNERTKYHDNIEKWERQMEDMRRNQANFDEQMRDLEEERDQKTEAFREGNGDLQMECSRLEAELKEKREQVKELEEARKTLLGDEEDGDWREKEAELRREGLQRSRELQELLSYETKHARKLDEQLRVLSLQVQVIPSTQAAYGAYNQTTSSAAEFDNPTVTQLKRRSRNSNSLSSISISSPLPPYSQIDPAASGPGFGSSRMATMPPGFAQAPYMDLSTDLPSRLDEAGIRASLAPLSPSATALLPSNILDDFDDDDPSPVPIFGPEAFMPHHTGSPDNDPQSPASSGRAMSILGSPHGSTHNLPFPTYQGDVDRRGLHTSSTMPTNSTGDAAPNKLMEFFSFQRARTAKGIEGEGPLLGSLKQGQSQSFPRQTDEPDGLNGKRRISLSGTWNMFNRNSAGPEVMEPHAPSSRMFSARNLNPFSSSHRAPGGLLAERDPSSPRPASIASSDFPRPSTDSGSIWGPPGQDLGKPRNLWSPDNMPWSRNPSRRPSLHGSPSALKTTLANADDEILDEDDAAPDVKEVGVIGSRPPNNSKAALGRLNPNAPAFIGSLFKPKSEKDGKEGKKTKDKTKEPKDKSKGKDLALAPDTVYPLSTEIDSPTDSRKSRDGYSVHTQTSLSESRDSLSLDQPFSNTPSEPTGAGLASSIKDDNVVRKLFRKSSSGKFSLPGRLGSKESGLFKKGPSSVASGANSDRGFSMERSSIGDLEEIGADEASSMNLVARSHDSVTSSPSLGPATGSVKSKDGGNKTSVRWLSNFGKKGKKEKESLDLDRAQVSELEGMADEGKA